LDAALRSLESGRVEPVPLIGGGGPAPAA
jgi:hypothetical protein